MYLVDLVSSAYPLVQGLGSSHSYVHIFVILFPFYYKNKILNSFKKEAREKYKRIDPIKPTIVYIAPIHFFLKK